MNRLFLIPATVLLVSISAGCAVDSTEPTPDPLPVDPDLPSYSRHRDATSNIAPILTAAVAGTGALEIDSPAVLVDPDRTGPEFLMYFESDPGGAPEGIGFVAASEPDFENHGGGVTVIAAGPAGSGYEAGATDPTVILDTRPTSNPPLGNRRYQMWFEGRGGAGGATSTIFVAVSPDGATWSTPMACTGLDAGFAPVRVADPTVVFEDGMYRMWFEAVKDQNAGRDGAGRLGHAESLNGLNWTVTDAAGNDGSAAAPVFEASAKQGFDGFGVHAPSVVVNPAADTDRYLLWYEAANVATDTENSIGFAVSVDGLTWTRFAQPVLSPSSDSLVPLPFDSGDLEHPSAWIDPSLTPADDGYFLLWYAADSEAGGSRNAIGLATGWMAPPQ